MLVLAAVAVGVGVSVAVVVGGVAVWVGGTFGVRFSEQLKIAAPKATMASKGDPRYQNMMLALTGPEVCSKRNKVNWA